eukprot:TRINITY_DN13193_c0_g2_i1.p1 TRINITY_DN13193_c0_g2~~TRINITY_DN13193_c0_g2_i1.p1  ORF type:complete len:472 (-),score=106.04 TRINITY_DN13193_c0_g2_i1:30-1445(-)
MALVPASDPPKASEPSTEVAVFDSTAIVPREVEEEDLFLHFIQLRRAERQRIREEQELQRQLKLRKQPVAALEGSEEPPAQSIEASSGSQKPKPTRPAPTAAASEEAPLKRGRGRPPGAQKAQKTSETQQQAAPQRPRATTSPLQSCLAEDGSVRGGCTPALIEVAQKSQAPAERLAVLEALERTASSEPSRLNRFAELQGHGLLALWLSQRPKAVTSGRTVADIAAAAAANTQQYVEYAMVAAACLRVLQLLPTTPAMVARHGLIQVCTIVGIAFAELRRDAVVLVGRWKTELDEIDEVQSQPQLPDPSENSQMSCEKSQLQQQQPQTQSQPELELQPQRPRLQSHLEPQPQLLQQIPAQPQPPSHQKPENQGEARAALGPSNLPGGGRGGRGRGRGRPPKTCKQPEEKDGNIDATLKEIQLLGELLEKEDQTEQVKKNDAGQAVPPTDDDRQKSFPSDCWDGYFPDPFL